MGWVTDTEVIGDTASIGVVLLFFIIGLELDPLKLSKLVGEVLLLALLEMGVAFGFGALASFLLNLTLIQSLIFSMTAAITSTAIAGKIFLERRTLRTGESTILIGLLIIEDVAAVGFLTVLSSLVRPGSPGGLTLQVLQTALGGLGLLALGYLVARYVAPIAINYLSHYEAESEEIPFLFALGLGFVFAILAAYFGYSPGTGAFVIGLAIRGKQSKFLSEKVGPIKDLFLVLFFVSMGSFIDPFPALSLGVLILISLALAIAGKFLGGILVGKIVSGRHSGEIAERAQSFGAWLVPRGEFSFVIGQFALSLGVIDSSLFSIIGVTVLGTAVVGPILQRLTITQLAKTEHPLGPRVDEGEL